jgi:arylsulfatase A-like enzyme
MSQVDSAIMEKQKSIVLVTVDCLRADHVGFMGYRRPVTPFLDALASESFVFPAAIVAGAPTFYSFPAILASRHPLGLGRDILGLGPDEPTLASVLQQAGYATAAFIAANPYISSRFGYAQGFNTFRDFLENEPEPIPDQKGAVGGWATRVNRALQAIRPRMGPLGVVYDELYFHYCQRVTPIPASLDGLRRFPAADVIVDHACTWLTSVGETPFFLWLHLMDPHSPYYPKEDALELMGDRPVTPFRARWLNEYWNRSNLGPRRFARHRDEIVRLYDAGIRWVDGQIARLIESLRQAKVWNDCIFVLTGDHGEEFLDHGGRYHPPSRLMEELIRVPLLMRVPGVPKENISDSPFSLLHLAPTLLDCVQVAVPASFRGRSYWPSLQRDGKFEGVAISECVAGCNNPFRPENRRGPRVLSVREARYKMVLHFEPKAEYLYDLEADPGEQAPLAPATHKMVRRRLLKLAREYLQTSSAQRDAKRRMQAQLSSLRLEWKHPASKTSAAAP